MLNYDSVDGSVTLMRWDYEVIIDANEPRRVVNNHNRGALIHKALFVDLIFEFECCSVELQRLDDELTSMIIDYY